MADLLYNLYILVASYLCIAIASHALIFGIQLFIARTILYQFVTQCEYTHDWHQYFE